MPEDLLTVVRNVARLMSLQRSGLLDTPPEETFDRFTRLASHMLRARTALLSLVDENRQFFKSATGLAEPWAGRRETPLTHSICKHVVEMGTGLVVPDGRVHPVLAGSPAVDECGFVAYTGMPVFAGDGHILGTLCVMDDRPREWTSSELDALQDLAACVTEAIALRTQLRESERACRASEARLAKSRGVASASARHRPKLSAHVGVIRDRCRLLLEVCDAFHGLGSQGRCGARDRRLSTALDVWDPAVKRGNQFVQVVNSLCNPLACGRWRCCSLRHRVTAYRNIPLALRDHGRRSNATIRALSCGAALRRAAVHAAVWRSFAPPAPVHHSASANAGDGGANPSNASICSNVRTTVAA